MLTLPKHPSQMTTADIMRFAHKLAKNVHKAGDCYAVTFGASLRLVYRLLKSEPVVSTLSVATIAVAAFVVMYCLGFTGYSLEAGSVGYAMLFSVFAAISAFVGLTVVKGAYKIAPTLNQQA